MWGAQYSVGGKVRSVLHPVDRPLVIPGSAVELLVIPGSDGSACRRGGTWVSRSTTRWRTIRSITVSCSAGDVFVVAASVCAGNIVFPSRSLITINCGFVSLK